MELNKKNADKAKGHFKILLTLIFTIVGLSVMIQTLAMSKAGGTGQALAQGPVITPTLTTEEKIQAYIDAHIISGDVMPEATPGAPDVGPQGSAANSVAWDGDKASLGSPGDVVIYTLTLSNTGTENDTYDITISSGWASSLSDTAVPVNSGNSASVSVEITIPGGATNGDSDTATITATSQTDAMVTASALLTTTVGSEITYLPIIFKALAAPTLSATRPNSVNDWQLNWVDSNASGVTGYELQQSQDPTFATNVTNFSLGSTVFSQLINTIQPSANNVYYYRVRSVGAGQNSPWSATVQVVGAYYDDFKSNQTGWSGPSLKEGLRRLTFIEKEDTWYENSDWLIIRVEDSWDWAIASPLKPAPKPPYVIEFSSQPANLGNLVSHGLVFGGDWAGAPCPDWSTLAGVYAHNNCFNHFYNTNLIWSSATDLTLLWERIDTLVYCPNCGGSPLKRLGDVLSNPPFHPNANNFNTYRIEVRQSGIKFFLNGDLRYTYNDTRWINDPYFGVFASTDEYSNSTWRYEYIRVTPLDN
ncbi:MAG: hypothetical protein IPM53_01655 [Anaerolineaceae bacterium]|nr:hypothetical protein [Anaerolineaceae bacterium]